MDLSQFATASFAIIGLINGLGFALDKNWRSFAYFMAGLAAGVLFGYLQWFGLPSVEMGVLVGLDASGVYKVAQKIAGKN